jgi:hypothetical protein
MIEDSRKPDDFDYWNVQDHLLEEKEESEKKWINTPMNIYLLSLLLLLLVV